jgi:hypothetical protein
MKVTSTNSQISAILNSVSKNLGGSGDAWNADDNWWSKSSGSSNKITSDIDMLAISVHQYRLYRDEPARRFVSFKQIVPDSEDYAEADRVADYFSKKIMWTRLSSDRNLTGFEQKVAEFLSSNRRVCDEKSLGLVYRMPEFYYTDQELIATIEREFGEYKISLLPESQTRTLEPVWTQDRKTRANNERGYWLRDVETGVPVKIRANLSFDQLVHVWHALFTSVKHLKISAEYRAVRHKLGFAYYDCKKWRLVIDE